MKVCTNWNEVSIKQFIKLYRLKNEDDLEYLLDVISILSDTPKDSININEIPELTKLTSFVSEMPTMLNVPTHVDINGQRYEINMDVTRLTGGGYIDLKNFTKSPEQIIDNLHNILAVFFIPMKKRLWWWTKGKYDGAQHREVAEIIYTNVNVGVAYPMAVFFWTLLNNWTKGIAEYTLIQAENQTKILEKQLKRTTRIGRGLSR